MMPESTVEKRGERFFQRAEDSSLLRERWTIIQGLCLSLAKFPKLLDMGTLTHVSQTWETQFHNPQLSVSVSSGFTFILSLEFLVPQLEGSPFFSDQNPKTSIGDSLKAVFQMLNPLNLVMAILHAMDGRLHMPQKS
jgi:hypothetical protein